MDDIVVVLSVFVLLTFLRRHYFNVTESGTADKE